MIEIPESTVISRQAENILIGKRISNVLQATSPHKFAWYNGDPLLYKDLLVGREIELVRGHGSFVDIILDEDVKISIGDGTNLKYYPAFEKYPVKHQLLIVFDDNSFLAFTVAMYGAIFAYKGELDNFYHRNSLESISPLAEEFDRVYFGNIFKSVKKDMSIKALLATEQRIPGLGNGVLQDILFKAGIHPKRKISTLSDLQRDDLFHCLKVTLQSMTEKGGRNTEKDFYGNWGRYKTLLSKNTYKDPCPNCGGEIKKEAYLGGSVYYCIDCQKDK
ncbi:formamidopyrimidine-DNA glycosylase [Dysgonomonas hofstadii]|uniref:Formamidopyrimidine-DNA glycosylase n=1 Tax=Dysgonomonas hofstadii TaxID=637886 RepID=A0A840CQC7_9BACT|nr:endonuclease VIII [Dysgonomonas hofstadii]MBB4035145.1 formamidopyrimidine-DNA glycosylase [Dysgonomonas hofstadii]